MKTTLSVLLARDAPVGVILRRGPSKQVLMIRWDLERDTFEAGQWLKGRVYGHCCDLSPQGDLLLYLASKYTGKQHGTWTAISRPPYFTALALWPLNGTWQGGGGVFSSQSQVALYQLEADLAPGFSLPEGFQVDVRIHGAVFTDRMLHDGWELVQQGEVAGGGKIDPPQVWSKPSPKQSPVSLRLQIQGYGDAPNPWVYAVIGESNVLDLSAADWADWCPSGDLLFARNGKIYRVAGDTLTRADGELLAKELVDLSAMRFEEREAPMEARRWEGTVPAGTLVSGHQVGDVLAPSS